MSNTHKPNIVKCSVKNCQKQIQEKDAIQINNNNYCKVCGTQLYREILNL